MMTTIFIHGTLPPSSLMTIAQVYSFFFCPLGLTPVKKLSEQYHQRKLTEILFKNDPTRFNVDHFYLYGWSGKLSREVRELEAEKLYELIKDLPRPLRIITYSHGGNIALRLAEVARARGDSDFKVDQLVLLACPVQRETKKFVASPIFSQVISIHSHRDMVQVLDPQGLYELAGIYKQAGLQRVFTYLQKMQSLFSERHFPHSENLLQINPLINGRNIWHIEFILPPFFQCLPKILDTVEQEGLATKQDDWLMEFKL